jgi:ferredoxin-type protein NapH
MAIFASLLLFPVILNYLSPYAIIDGAMQGLISGSFMVFMLVFLSSLLIGRLWCAYLCPGAGQQEMCFAIK